MLVIHPKDKTTAMLSALYDGLEAQVVADYRTTKEMGRLLHHVSTQERIMLLGHGSDKGLFFRADDSKDEFDKIIVSHSHAYHLRKHTFRYLAQGDSFINQCSQPTGQLHILTIKFLLRRLYLI